jgi:short-subunit dehydrogenase
LMKIVEERGLVIDTLINNAGFGDTGRFDQEDTERIFSMLQVNVVALTELTRFLLPQMVARKRGKVMLLASSASFLPGPGMAVYYATKSYVLSFGRAIGYELRGTGVTVTTLCPGPTTSEFAQVANMQGVALLEGPMPVMTATEVARQGYAALKAERPQIIAGLVNSIIAMSEERHPRPGVTSIPIVEKKKRPSVSPQLGRKPSRSQWRSLMHAVLLHELTAQGKPRDEAQPAPVHTET